MWFYNNENVALNLSKATTISIKKVSNKFKVYAYYTEGIQEKYILNTFNTLQEAQTFIKNTINNLNTTYNNSGSSISSDPNKIEYAFIQLDN